MNLVDASVWVHLLGRSARHHPPVWHDDRDFEALGSVSSLRTLTGPALP